MELYFFAQCRKFRCIFRSKIIAKLLTCCVLYKHVIAEGWFTAASHNQVRTSLILACNIISLVFVVLNTFSRTYYGYVSVNVRSNFVLMYLKQFSISYQFRRELRAAAGSRGLTVVCLVTCSSLASLACTSIRDMLVKFPSKATLFAKFCCSIKGCTNVLSLYFFYPSLNIYPISLVLFRKSNSVLRQWC